MDIRQEKEYIYQMMAEVTNERRKLAETYFDLKQRLDKLDELELIGLDKTGTKGYFDLLNSRNKSLATTNISREIEYQKKIENLEENLAEVNKPEENKFIPEKEIIKDKEKELDKDKKDNRVNLDQALMAIITTLKDSGTPMKVSDLHTAVERKLEREIGVNNFRANIIKRALEKEPRITRASRGYYQYSRSMANTHS